MEVLLLLAPDPAPEVLSTGYGWSLLKILVALVVVCGAAYGMLLLVRRLMPATAKPRGCMRIIDRCPLSARQQLWLVEVTGRYFLVGATDTSLTRLAELDPADIPPAEEAERRSFAEILKGKGRSGS